VDGGVGGEGSLDPPVCDVIVVRSFDNSIILLSININQYQSILCGG
jgi:hypothetical protein